MFRALIIFLFALCLGACSLLPKKLAQPPAATITLPSGAAVTQTGDAQKPASVSTDTTTTTLPLPAGTEFVFDQKLPGVVTLRLSHDSALTTETKTEKAEAPQAFTPPAPPGPVELAAGKARLFYGGGLVVGLALGLFGLVRGWDMIMYGGGAVAAACGFAIFAQSHPVLIGIIGAGAALAVAGPALWHLKLKQLEPKQP